MDYTNVYERESGLHKIICYPNTGNPYEFGFDNNTDRVKIIWIYNTSDRSVKLFDDITDKSTLVDIENLQLHKHTRNGLVKIRLMITIQSNILHLNLIAALLLNLSGLLMILIQRVQIGSLL